MIGVTISMLLIVWAVLVTSHLVAAYLSTIVHPLGAALLGSCVCLVVGFLAAWAVGIALRIKPKEHLGE